MRSASLVYVPRSFPPFTDHTFAVNVFLVELIKPLALPVNDVPVMRTVAEWQKSGNQMKHSLSVKKCLHIKFLCYIPLFIVYSIVLI